MHIYLLAVVGFVEEVIETIHLPTGLYENALWSAFALEANERAPFHLRFNFTSILIFTSVTALQSVFFSI